MTTRSRGPSVVLALTFNPRVPAVFPASPKGVGPKRRQMLLKYMGGLQGLLNASMEEIAKVPGISQGLAEKIYYSLKH